MTSQEFVTYESDPAERFSKWNEKALILFPSFLKLKKYLNSNLEVGEVYGNFYDYKAKRSSM